MNGENSSPFAQRPCSPSKALLTANTTEPESPGSEWSLKAHPGSATKIPKPPPGTPLQGIINQGLFSTPLPTPSQPGLREEGLRKIEQELKHRLEAEREALERAKCDKAIAEHHEARLNILTNKLKETQETQEKLATVQEEYAQSAKKKLSLERNLRDREAAAAVNKAGSKSNKLDLSGVRNELRIATEFMSAAAARVEQMEKVCDMLMERMQELENTEGALRLERNTLVQDLAQQQEISREKEVALADALELAKQGTPQGNDAKKRLPELMGTLRDTQLALASEREAAERLVKEKAELQQRLKEQHGELVADKERELARVKAEKNASLESLVRATAAATKEAGKLNEQHETVKAQLQQSQQQAQQLQGELSSLQADYADACSSKADLLKQVQTLEKRLTIEANIRTQLKSDVLAKSEAAVALQAELAALKERYQSELSCVQYEATAAEQRCTKLLREQQQLEATKASLEEQLAQREAAAAEMSDTLAAAQQEVARLDTVNAELKVAMAGKVATLESEVASLCAEREALEREADAMSRNMEEMARQLQVNEEEFKKQAKAGTPRGEGAKIVARLAFKKIKELQAVKEVQRGELETKSASIMSLRTTIAGLEEAARQHGMLVRTAEAKLAQAEGEAAKVRGELEAQLQHTTARCSKLEEDTTAAAVRMAALESELQRDREEADDRVAELAAQVSRLEADLAAAGSERAALQQQLEAAGRDAATLSSDVAAKAHQLDALRQEMAAAQAEVEAKAKEAQDALQQLAGERDAIAGEKDAAQRQLEELRGQVEALRQEVVEARGVGTPHGEAAKTVSRLALEKIRKIQIDEEERSLDAEKKQAELQACLQELQAALDGKTAELARIQGQLKEAASAAERTQHEMQARIIEMEAGLAAAEAAKAIMKQRLGKLDAELQQLTQSACAKEAELAASVASLTAELEAASASKEAIARDLASAHMRLEIAQQEAATKIGSLQAQVEALTVDKAAAFEARSHAEIKLAALEAELSEACNELETAKTSGTPKGEAAKQVSRLAFQRIKELQGAIEDARLEVVAKEERILHMEQAAQSTEAERRRLQAQCEELRRSVDKYGDSDSQLQDQIMSLTDQRKSLHSEVANLSGEVESLQTLLGIVRHEANSANRALGEAQGQRNELHDSLTALKAQCGELVAGKAAAEAQAAELVAVTEELREQLSATSAQLEEVRGEFTAFRAASEAAASEAQQFLAGVEAERERLKAARAAAAADVDRLEAELAGVKSQGTPQGAAAKQTVKLAFDKIRGIQLDLEEKCKEVKSLEAQLEAQQDIASQLSAEVQGKAAQLTKQREALAEAQSSSQHLKAELNAAVRKLAEQAEEVSQLQAQKAEVEAALQAAEAGARGAGDEAAFRTAKLVAAKATLAAELAAATEEAGVAHERVAAFESELTAAQAAFEHRLADSAVQGTNWQAAKYKYEATLAQLREEAESDAEARRTVQAEKQAAEKEVARLSSKIVELNAEVESLRDTISHLGSVLNKMSEHGNEAEGKSESEWLELVADARSERDAMAAAKAEAEHRAAELTGQLSVAMADLEAAKVQGTPGGAAAKQVAKLSLQKLRDMQQELATAHERASTADRQSNELSASLQAAQAKLDAAKTEAAGLAERMRQQAAEMQALQSKVQQEEEGRREATSQVIALEKALAAARDEASALAQLRSAAESDAAARVSPLQEEVNRLKARLAAVSAEREVAERKAAEAGAALAAAQQLWAAQEQLNQREEELAAAQYELTGLAAEVSRLSSSLQIKDKQLAEQQALLKQVAQALEGQKQTNQVAKQLHMERVAELAKAVEQACCRSSQLEAEGEALRSQASRASLLETQNWELTERLRVAETAAAAARAAENEARKAAEGAGRHLEQQASQREAELRGSLRQVSKELQEVKERCEGAEKKLRVQEDELAATKAVIEAQRRQKHAAEVAAVLALSVLVLAGGAAAVVCRI